MTIGYSGKLLESYCIICNNIILLYDIQESYFLSRNSSFLGSLSCHLIKSQGPFHHKKYILLLTQSFVDKFKRITGCGLQIVTFS